MFTFARPLPRARALINLSQITPFRVSRRYQSNRLFAVDTQFWCNRRPLHDEEENVAVGTVHWPVTYRTDAMRLIRGSSLYQSQSYVHVYATNSNRLKYEYRLTV